jgi:hypothetical protein
MLLNVPNSGVRCWQWQGGATIKIVLNIVKYQLQILPFGSLCPSYEAAKKWVADNKLGVAAQIAFVP